MKSLEYELPATFDSARSFYGKAKVIEKDGNKTLVSYKTDVMYYKDGALTRSENQPQSNTTARHMREFAQQCSFPWMSKAQLLKLPIE